MPTLHPPPLFAAVALALVAAGGALICFKCNERVANTDVCRNSTEDDCNIVFPQQPAVCLKTVQRFSTGQPSWVFAQCQIAAAFSDNQVDTCQISNTQGANNATDTLETCTCTVDFCNRAPKSIVGIYQLAFFVMLAMLLQR